MKNKILLSLFQQINEENIFSVIYYGNKGGQDIYLCLIVDSSIYYERKVINNLDLTIFEKKYFFHLLKLLDPLVCEPLLTGEVIYGENLSYYSKIIFDIKPTAKIITHLYNSANIILQNSKELYKQKKYRESLNNIIFSLSYLAYADYYLSENNIILFKDLLTKNYSLLNKSYMEYKRNKLINKEIIKYFINKTEEMISTLT